MRRLNVKQANTRRERINRRLSRRQIQELIKAKVDKRIEIPEEINGTVNS